MSAAFTHSGDLQSRQKRGYPNHHVQLALRSTKKTEKPTVPATPPKKCSQVRPDGVLVPATHDEDPGHGPNSPRTPSSSRRPNIGLRRSDRSSIFSKSPARHGHSIRMKGIFEAASLHPAAHARINNTLLYPQLPNVSRGCEWDRHHGNSTVKHYSNSTDSPASQLHVPYATGVQSNDETCNEDLPHPTKSAKFPSPTGSWSGDSDFLIDESVLQRAVSPSVPSSRLRAEGSYSPPFDLSHENSLRCLTPRRTLADQSPRWISTDTQSTFPSIMQQEFASLHLELESEHVSTPPPSGHASDDDGGDEMSPLSPNVCVERGPARRHSSIRKHRETLQPQDTPTRTSERPLKSCLKKSSQVETEQLGSGRKVSRWGVTNAHPRRTMISTNSEDMPYQELRENGGAASGNDKV